MPRGYRTAVGAAIAAVLIALSLFITSLAGADAESVLYGTDGPDVITGTPADDTIYGRAGNDKISAGDGNDDIDGGAGADQMSGGDGNDTVIYSGTAPVDASLDGLANDGAAGEGDQIMADVENLYGGDGNDKLTGNAGPNTISGGAGDDRITGGPGSDMLSGDEGDDVIDARDGEVDRVDCGPGNDTATVDKGDVVTDCEQVSKQATTLRPGITIKVSKRRIIVSSIVSKSTFVMACATSCGKRYPASKPLYKNTSVKLRPGRVAYVPLKSVIRGHIIEIGVRAPDASPVCIRLKIPKRTYAYKVLKGSCSSVAKDI